MIEWVGAVTGAQVGVGGGEGVGNDEMNLDVSAALDWEEALEIWRTEELDDPSEDREEAARLIQGWAQNPYRTSQNLQLSLNGLGLTSLPALPPDLTDLNIEDNQLSHLPEILPPGLVELDASGNLLTELPENWPQGLTTLNVSNNDLAKPPHDLPQSLVSLSVGGSRLTYLPDTLPESLKYLNVSDNQLAQLPGSLPGSLVELDVSENQLAHLPENLPSSLTHLAVARNRLTQLPEALPANLRVLEVMENHLTHLPENLPSNLTSLSIAENHVTELPEALPENLQILIAHRNQLIRLPGKLPSNLTRIALLGNHLTSLPDALPALLHSLELNNNRLTSLPEDLPSSLRHVLISHNQITNLPESILTLSSECEINLAQNPLPENVRNNLAAAMSVPGYNGPQIFFSMAAGEPEQPVRPLHEEAGAWLGGDPAAVDTWATFASEDGAPEYARFLHRLSGTVNASNPDFRRSVATDLRDAAAHPTLRQKFFLRAFGATETCEDRVTLTWNAMQTDRLSDEVEQGNYDNRLDELMPHALRLSRLDALDRIARDKVRSLRFVDEIEVYLAFQNKLRQRLNLEAMVAPDMRFFDVSYVTEADLDAAEAKVRAEEAAEFTGYLAAQWEPWDKLLARIVPEAHEAMQEALIEAMDEPFRQRLEQRLREEQLTGDADAERTLGKEVRDELAREIKGRLTQQVLQERNLAHLID